jgi:hypothetical protein
LSVFQVEVTTIFATQRRLSLLLRSKPLATFAAAEVSYAPVASGSARKPARRCLEEFKALPGEQAVTAWVD